jgi:hypothetical protein
MAHGLDNPRTVCNLCGDYRSNASSNAVHRVSQQCLMQRWQFDDHSHGSKSGFISPLRLVKLGTASPSTSQALNEAVTSSASYNIQNPFREVSVRVNRRLAYRMAQRQLSRVSFLASSVFATFGQGTLAAPLKRCDG